MYRLGWIAGLFFFMAHASAQVPPDLMLVDAAPGGSFDTPLAVRNANDGSGRLFVIEKCGKIQIVKNGVVNALPFLSVSVACNSEQGLLGLAFHPDYIHNGIFYVTYTDPGSMLGTHHDQVLARFTVSSNPDSANTTGTVVLRVPDLADNHNGGDIHFGADGYLYWSMGDGGVQPDPNGFAQCLWKKRADGNPGNCSTTGGSGALYYLLGKIMRLDVDHPTASAQANACGATPAAHAEYSIPATNPYADLNDPANATRCGEIWAYGLRNPFRFSFDRSTHDMLIGDVGYSTTEEVDFQTAASSAASAYNYGWRDCEGPFPRGQTSATCTIGILPILHFFHNGGAISGCSVIGGYRYRGPYSRLDGTYLFGDLCSGPLIGTHNGSIWTLSAFAPGGVSITHVYGFGESEAGDVYLADGGAGKIYKYILDEVFLDGFELD
ncbi:MAG TPA: PQQ-dependent sugar dehydrogenase [Rudaea sp.]|nr:PQQ-dependent sugar dehydrogenase [Rudaea sp.]